MSKNLYILLEGQHEEKFIIDFRENWGEFLSDTDFKVIKAGQIDMHMLGLARKYDEIYFVVDKDVESVNKKIASAKIYAENNDSKLTAIQQNPEFGAFCASCFSDFVIKKTWNDNRIKAEASEFLSKIDPGINLKKWTYTDIVNNGGNIQNANRYKDRFEIIGFLHLINNVI